MAASNDRTSLGVAVAVAVIVFAIVLATIVVVRRPSEVVATAGYSEETRAAFVASCTAGGAEAQSTCTCAYDKIVQAIPYDRYLELNRQFEQRDHGGVRGTAAPGTPATSALPNDLEVMIVSCIAREALTTPSR